jgi:hypothetical protein
MSMTSKTPEFSFKSSISDDQHTISRNPVLLAIPTDRDVAAAFDSSTMHKIVYIHVSGRLTSGGCSVGHLAVFATKFPNRLSTITCGFGTMLGFMKFQVAARSVLMATGLRLRSSGVCVVNDDADCDSRQEASHSSG